jgi:mono/diheme cytochrome c family protein
MAIALATLALFIAFAIPQLALAQTGSSSMLDNTALLVAIIVGIVLITTIGGGIAIALIARVGTRFLDENVPPDDKMVAFEKQEAAVLAAERSQPRKPIKISPTAEPFVIAVGGFLVVFILASLFVTPPAEKGNAAGTPSPAAPSGLPTSGDFTKIVAGLPKGNPDNGAKLFMSMGCSGCHGQQKDQRIVGPSFYGLWGRAATRKPGYGSAEYIYESIVSPNAYVVPGFQAGIMPQTFSKQLSPQDMADILAWIQRDHNEPQ